MKRLGWMLVGILALGPATFAGTKDELLSIDELRMPSSPAFTLLGVSPTAVERPSTPRAFALGVLSASESSDSSLPQDLSMEFAPFWWKSRTDLTFDSYYFGTDGKRPGVGKTILRTFSVSLATTEFEDSAGMKGTNAGLGFRFAFLQGKPAPDLKKEVDASVKKLKKLQLAFLDCVSDLREDEETEEPGGTEQPEYDATCVAEKEPAMRKAGRNVAKTVGRMNKERLGWSVEFAAAATESFPEDDTAQRSRGKVGAWFTASYNGKPRNLSYVMVSRYIRDDTVTDSESRVDVGARLIWTADPRTMPPLGLSLEYVRRFNSDVDDEDRLVAVLEYRLPLDNISVIASYGKTLSDDFVGQSDLVSTLGINFGFGRGQTVKLPSVP